MPDGSNMNPRTAQTPIVLRLWIEAPNATNEQLQRGIDALREVFEKAGTNPWEAASAAYEQESADDMGLYEPPGENDPEPPPPTAEEIRKGDVAEAWRAAYWAALKACVGYDLDKHAAEVSFDEPANEAEFKPIPELNLSIRPASPDDAAEQPRLEFTVAA